MSERAPRYPLAWPTGWVRTPSARRRRAAFSSYRKELSVSDALGRLARELRLLGATDEILSTNVRIGLRGLPLSDGPQPTDTGAAVYFTLKGQPRCLACDKWNRVADNIAALAQHIDAIRRIDRYGVGTVEQAFAGYTALPASAVDWWIVLGISRTATLDDVDAAFTKLAREHHPDLGGRHEDMARLTEARVIARKALGAAG